MDLVQIVAQGGPLAILAVLAWLFIDERKERKALQERIYGKDGLHEQTLNALNACTTTLNSWRDLLGNKGNNG